MRVEKFFADMLSLDWVLPPQYSNFNNWASNQKSNPNRFQNQDYLRFDVISDETFVPKAFM